MPGSTKPGMTPSRWIQPSTRTFFREADRTPGFSIFDKLHGYIYLRWSYTYIAIGLGEHWVNRWLNPILRLFRRTSPSKPNSNGHHTSLADVYHGKVLRTEGARQLVTVGEDVELRDLEKIIPYRHARDIVLQDPDHIIVIDCPCRTSRKDPCLPLDVCLVVGEPFASFIAEHHPDKAKWIDPDTACQILEREHARGRVHQAFFKDATLGRFYVICNCCSCCCGAMQARKNGNPLLASSGYVSQVDPAVCIQCGECVERCPFGAISDAEDVILVDQDLCMGCGVCVDVCSAEALEIRLEPSKGVPLEVAALISAQRAEAERISQP